MAKIIYSANMNMPIPVAGQQTGQDYALNVDASLLILDSHDHSSGNGVQITPNGININSDFPLNNNNLTIVKSVRFQAQTSLPAVSPNLLCFYTVGNDVYFNDGAGNVVRITQSGSVTGSSGTITGLPSGTASAAYVAGSGKFVFQSSTNTGADLDAASIIVREKVTNGKSVTLSAAAGLAADYTLIFPTALPASQNFLVLDNAGQISNGPAVSAGINTSNIADGAITKPKLAALGQQISSSSGAFTVTTNTRTDVTNLTVKITTTGRPVVITLIPAQPGNMNLSILRGNNSATMYVYLVRDSTDIYTRTLEVSAFGASQVYSSFDVPYMIDVVAAGTYTYKMAVQNVGSGTVQTGVIDARLIAYEL